jgi:hypothetical protein
VLSRKVRSLPANAVQSITARRRPSCLSL